MYDPGTTGIHVLTETIERLPPSNGRFVFGRSARQSQGILIATYYVSPAPLASSRACFLACFSASFARFSSSLIILLACFFATSRQPVLKEVASTSSAEDTASDLNASWQSEGKARVSFASFFPSKYS